MLKNAVIAIILFGLWLLMSGIFKPLLIILGVVSAILCVWIANRLFKTETNENIQTHKLRPIRTIKYLAWLVKEVAKADWEVTKIILDTKQVNQKLIRVRATQKYALTKALFANSITMTPGTITVETEDDGFIVHALTKQAANPEGLKNMNDKVAELEKT